MSATQVYYQETTIDTVLDAWVKGYQPPNGGTILRAESCYDPRTGKVWFKLYVELPTPDDNHVLVMEPDRTIRKAKP